MHGLFFFVGCVFCLVCVFVRDFFSYSMLLCILIVFYFVRARGKKQAGDHDPSTFYPSFELDCLRQPYGGPSPAASASGGDGTPGAISSGSPTSTTMDDDDDGDGDTNASLRSMRGGDDGHAPPPSPARLEMVGGGRGRGLGGIAAALEEAGDNGGQAGVPETPFRRPGSGARSRVLERSAGSGGDGSCSPVGGYGGLDG